MIVKIEKKTKVLIMIYKNCFQIWKKIKIMNEFQSLNFLSVTYFSLSNIWFLKISLLLVFRLFAFCI